MRTAKRTAKDAASGQPLTGCEIACGYAGGASAYHTWTRAEWDAQPARWRLPIWVPDPAADPVGQAHDCLGALGALGVPDGTAYSLDMETSSNSVFVHAFAKVTEEHYLCVPYGSAGNIFSLPPRSGWWVADPTGVPHFYPHKGVVGTQWAFTPGYDESWFDDTLPLWDTQVKAPAQREYLVVELPGGQAFKALSGDRLK
jgi:hypothetical protein